jgi:hypothetical protein
MEFSGHLAFVIEEVHTNDIRPEDGSSIAQYEVERIPQARMLLPL